MRHFSRHFSIVVLGISVLAHGVNAQEKPADKSSENTDDAARVLFDAGAKAYAAGLFAEAVIAFREAHTLAPDRPTVLFSLAQAERRQYTVKQDPEMLEAAIAHFRKYLEIVHEGGRRADVVVALGELDALRAGTETPAKKAARIFITTETPGASIFIDGRKRDQVPVIEEAPPGKHVIKIEAPGFLAETREILAIEGTIFPIEINLQEKPSFLSIKAPNGSSITVDGRVYGDAPLTSPLELSSGAHRLIIMQRGYIPFDERFSIERAGTRSVNVALESTMQRRVSYVMLGAASAGFGVGTALAIAAIVKDSEASRIYNEAQKQNINNATLAQYTSALDARDKLRGAALGTLLFSFGLGAATAATYWFDSSSQHPLNKRREAQFSVTPLAGGGFVSFGMGF